MQANIASRAMSSAGWRKGEPPEPANEAGGAKPRLNAGSLVLQDGGRGGSQVLK